MEFDSDSSLINTNILNLDEREKEVLDYINNQEEPIQFYLKPRLDGYIFVHDISEINHGSVIKWIEDDEFVVHFTGFVLKVNPNGTFICKAFRQFRYLNFYNHDLILRKKTKAEIILGMYTKLGLNNLKDFNGIKVNMLNESEDEKEES